MKPFSEQIESLVEQGYYQAAAQAKVAHDAVLLAMDVCGFKKSSTIKGGVVMSHVTNDAGVIARVNPPLTKSP